jgi:DNA-binding transcriptional LysR family regulator
MNKFQGLVVFAAVAEAGGFTAAARKLGLSTSAVTKIVARLEDDLASQLFNRSTRRLVLTDYGQEFYERSIKILTDLEDAETMVREANATPRGVIKAVVPFSFGRVTLVPALTEFSERYPDIRLNLTFLDDPVDLIAEGFDVGVRTGVLSDSRTIARVLTRGPQITFAAPSYLARYGQPRTLEELHCHACIVGRFGAEWSFLRNGGDEITLRVEPRHVVLSGDALREAVVAGLGISQATWWLVRKDLEAGRVVPILTDYERPGRPVSVIYPAKRHLPSKVRVFVDYLVEITRDEPLRPGTGAATRLRASPVPATPK